MLPPELLLLQEVASSVRAVANSPLSARLQKETMQTQAHEPADDVPVGMQEPQVNSCAGVFTASERCSWPLVLAALRGR